MFDQTIFKKGSKILLKNAIIGIILSLLITGVFMFATVNYTVNGESVTNNDSLNIIYTIMLPLFMVFGVIIYSFYSYGELFPMSVGLSKTRSQFLVTNLITQIGVGGILVALSVAIVAVEAHFKVGFQNILNEINIPANEAIGIMGWVILSILSAIAFTLIVSLLSYRFGSKFWIIAAVLYFGWIFISAIPSISAFIDAIVSQPWFQAIQNFRDSVVGSIVEMLLGFIIVIILTLRLAVTEKASN